MPEALPEHLLENVAGRFRVLGDATRLAILRTLLQEGEANVGEIVERLHASQANVSKHLRILQQAGIVSRRQDGTAAFYAVTDQSVMRLCEIVCDRLQGQAESEARRFAVR